MPAPYRSWVGARVRSSLFISKWEKAMLDFIKGLIAKLKAFYNRHHYYIMMDKIVCDTTRYNYSSKVLNELLDGNYKRHFK